MSHLQQLLRRIHQRFEQKFKDYRHAFRSFDVNFDGRIEFQEFVQGLQLCGIAMPLEDYRIVFSVINYDNTADIGFQNFCLINIDKSNNVLKLIQDTKKGRAKIAKMLQL